MTAGGALLLGTTIGIAWLDGGLSAFLTASAIGGGTYVVVRRASNVNPEKILNIQKRSLELGLEQAIKAGAKDEDVKAAKKEIGVAMDRMKEMHDGQRWGNKELACAAGVAAFACPALGAVALASVTHRTWVPWLARLAPKPELQTNYLVNAVLQYKPAA